MLKDRLIVALSTGVYVFNLLQGFAVELLIKTCPNLRGACAISSNNEMSVLATLAKEEGFLTIQNYYLKSMKTIKAFTSGIQNVAISLDVFVVSDNLGTFSLRC